MTLATSACAALCAGMSGCASGPESIVSGPTSVPPPAPPAYVERSYTGAIYQPNNPSIGLFSDQYRPHNIGDTLKIDISETLNSSNKRNTEISRDNKVASKGPGTGDSSLNGVLRGILNLDASASGSDSFNGAGKLEASNTLSGKLAASVINVLPNGNLVVAGEKQIGLDGSVSTLRFSGIVNPKDIAPGGTVASSDVVNARLEHLGHGGIHETASRSWLQKVLTDALSVW